MVPEVDDDIDILDAALDEILQSNEPFLLPSDAFPDDKDPVATLANESLKKPSKSFNLEHDTHEQVAVDNPPRAATLRPRSQSGGIKVMTVAQKKAQAKETQRVQAREAQRRFRARQKNVIAELEDRVEIMRPQLEQEREKNKSLSFKNNALENLLLFKDSQVAAMEELRNERKIEDRLYPEILVLHKKYSLPGVYTLEKLLRFAPAGYTDHLDDDIFAIQAPPLSVQIEQWRITIMKMQTLIAEASRGINNNSPSSDSTPATELASMLLRVHLDEATKKGTEAAPSPTQPTGVDIIDAQGVRFEYCGIKYLITKDLMKRVVEATLLIGTQIWQMGVFFPETMMEFATTNMESGQSAATSLEFNDIGRWINVIRMIDFRQEQLQTFARAHYQYLSIVRPMWRERATIMQHLMQSASRQTDSIKDHIEATADLGDCTSALAAIVRKEYAAWVDLLGSTCAGCLDYPVQRMMIWTLSYPYMPNPNLVGAAAALELGLNPFEYQFNESDFEKAPFLRVKE